MRLNHRQWILWIVIWTSASLACARLPEHGTATSQDAAVDVPTAPSSPSGVAQGNLLLPTRSGYFTGSDANPLAIAAVDINHDALPDIAVATWNANAVWTMINRGHGHFDAGVRSTVDGQPRAIFAIDFTHDGNIDLVAASYASNSFVSYVGDGSGGFNSPSVLFQCLNTVNFITADYLDQDGLLDLVSICEEPNGLRVHLAASGGGFAKPVAYTIGGMVSGAAIADLNGDGYKDIIVGNLANQNATMLTGTGSGTFTIAATIPIGVVSRTIVLADANVDGKLDLLASAASSNDFAVALASQPSVFGKPTVIGSCSGAVPLVTLDADHDGFPDVLLGCWAGGGATLYYGSTNGTFSRTRSQKIGVAGRPWTFVPADFDQDGIVDIGIGTASSDIGHANRSSFFSVVFGSTAGLVTPQIISVGLQPRGVAAKDINGDGYADLVTSNYGGASVGVALGGSGGVALSQTLTAAPSPCGPPVLADVNGDSNIDILVANQNDASVNLFLGKGSGQFAARTGILVRSPSSGLSVADINGDGSLDMAVCYAGDSNLVDVYMGDGKAGFQFGVSLTANSNYVSGVAFGDINGDGAFDLVANTDTGVNTWLNNRDATFGSCQTLSDISTTTLSPPDMGDFNGDGLQDVVATYNGIGYAAVFRGTSDGGSGLRAVTRIESLSPSPVAAKFVDINQDGFLDVVITSYNGSHVAVSLGNGLGNFSAPTAYATVAAPYSIAVGDFNGDGTEDFAVGADSSFGFSSPYGAEIAVHLNTR